MVDQIVSILSSFCNNIVKAFCATRRNIKCSTNDLVLEKYDFENYLHTLLMFGSFSLREHFIWDSC